MQTIKPRLLISFMVVVFPLIAHSQWQPTTGTEGRDIRSIYVASGVAYAGSTGGGFFVSTDNGVTWVLRNTGLPNLDINGIVSLNSSLFVAAYGEGVFASTNGGISWSAYNTGLLNLRSEELTVHSGNLYVSIWDADSGGVFASTNGGLNWSPVVNGLTERRTYKIFSNGANLYVTATSGKVFSSANDGASWTSISNGLPAQDIRTGELKGSYLFAGSISSGIYRSTDIGGTWTASGLPGLRVNEISVTGSTMFAATGTGVFRSTDDGQTWVGVNDGLTNTNLMSMADGGSYLLVGTSNGGIWRRPLTEFLSQPPVITDFLPLSGPIGTVVTISGSGFGATVGSNVVYAGGVECPVLTASPTSLTVQIPFGANYAPLSVTANHSTSFSRVPFVVTFPTSDVLERNSFIVQQNAMSTGELPFGIAIGDLNRDGKTDLVSSSNDATPLNGEGFDVFENTSAQGGAVAFGQRVVFSAGVVTRMVGTGDFDGDGWLDMAVVNYRFNGDTTVSLYRNRGLVGTAISTNSFEPRVDFRVGHDPREIVIADFNLDGKVDMAVTNIYKQKVTVLRNIHTNFGGAFSSASFDTVQFPAGVDTVLSIVAGDLNGDGKPEIILGHANSGDNSIRILLNTSTGSTISFDPAPVSVVAGGRGDGVSLGDVDGDGDLDILVTLLLQRSFCVLRNNGGLTFTRYEFAAGEKPRLAAVGDLDGDGKPDIAIANRGGDPPTAVNDSIYVYKNTSSGGAISFAPLLDFVTAYEPRTLSIGDMNADGKPEILVANRSSNTISVFRNAVRQPATITSMSPGFGPVGSTVTIQGQRFHPVADSNRIFFGSVRGNVVSASPSLLSAIAPSGNSFAPLSIIKDGLYSAGAQFVTTFPSSGVYGPSSLFYQTSPVSSDSPRVIAAGDLDGDGKPDMVAIRTLKDGFSIFRNITSDSTIAFSLVIDSVAAGGKPEGLALGDVNGDGKPDVVVMNTALRKVYVFINNSTPGNISLGERRDFLISGNSNALPRDIGLGDFDGDGRLDLVTTMQVLAGNPDSIIVLRNLSSIGNVLFGSPVGINVPSPGFPRGLDILDVDRDGRTDIVVTDWGRGETLVLRNTSTVGNLAVDPVITELPAGVNPLNTALGDLNGDGKPDLVTANFGDSSISVYENTSSAGSISFQSHTALRTARQPRVSLSDVNGDGHPDIIAACGASEVLQVFINRSGSFDSLFAAPVVFNGPSQLGIATLADFNVDGKPDVVTANQELNTISVFRNTLRIESASFQANPGTLSFGGVAVGGSAQDSILVTNVGGATLNISSVQSLDTLRFRVSPGSADLNQLQSTSFRVIFSPTLADTFDSKIIFTHNALPNQSDTIIVSGRGLASGFGLSSMLAAFGNVLVGDTARNTVTVRNNGNTGLTVQSATASNPAFGVAPAGASILPGDSALFTISFRPTVTGTQTGFALFAHNAQGSPDSVAVSGTGVLPVFQTSTGILDFGSVVIGQSDSENVAVQNTGGALLRITAVNSTGSAFTVVPDTASITGGGVKNFVVRFTPASVGQRNDTLRFIHNAASSPDMIIVNGRGATAGFASSQDPFDFGNVAVDTQIDDSVYIRNTGTVAQVVDSVKSTNGAFILFGNSNSPVPPGDSLGIFVRFAPTSSVIYSGILRVFHNNDTSEIAVTGRGAAPGLLVNPTSLAFGQVSLGFDSTRTIIASNTGTGVLAISSVVSQDPSFVVTRDTATLVQGDTAQFGIRFLPLDTGPATGQIIFTYGGTLHDTVSTTGGGVLPVFAIVPNQVTFGTTSVNDTADTVLTIINGQPEISSMLRLDLLSVNVPDFVIVPVADTLLQPNEQATVNVLFRPTQRGVRPGILSIYYNGQENPRNISLSGTGVQSSYAFVGGENIDLGDVYVGLSKSDSSRYAANLLGDGPLRIRSITPLSGAAFSCAIVPNPIQPGASGKVIVTFSPTSFGSASTPIVIEHNANSFPDTIYVTGNGIALAAPVLGSPRNDSSGVGPSAVFSWSATPGASGYEFQLSTQSAFQDTLINDPNLGVPSKTINQLAYNTSYYWRVRAKSGAILGVFSTPFRFTTKPSRAFDVSVYNFPQAPSSSQDYRMVSFPGTRVFTAGELLTGDQNTNWRIFRETGGPDNNHLEELAAGSSLGVGQGYWLVRTGAFTFSQTVSMPALVSNGLTNISLHSGWNIIGNPFEVAVPWNNVLEANNLSSGQIFGYGGASGFVVANTMNPFSGYYFENTSSLSSLKIPYPFPGQGIANLASPPVEWQLRLMLRAGNLEDRENFIGIAPGALGERDPMDLKKPPTFSDQAFLFFNRPVWDGQNSQYRADFRPTLGDGQIWEFTVQNPGLASASITVSGLEALSPDTRAVLVNLHNTSMADLQQSNVYSYQTVGSKMAFKLIVGSQSFVEGEYGKTIPTVFSLEQNYPNPFNPSTSLTFKLPQDSDLRLEILSLLGAHVATVADGRYARGTHTAMWDGMNDNGSNVASGMYLYRLMIDGKQFQIRKMMLLR